MLPVGFSIAFFCCCSSRAYLFLKFGCVTSYLFINIRDLVWRQHHTHSCKYSTTRPEHHTRRRRTDLKPFKKDFSQKCITQQCTATILVVYTLLAYICQYSFLTCNNNSTQQQQHDHTATTQNSAEHKQRIPTKLSLTSTRTRHYHQYTKRQKQQQPLPLVPPYQVLVADSPAQPSA